VLSILIIILCSLNYGKGVKLPFVVQRDILQVLAKPAFLAPSFFPGKYDKIFYQAVSTAPFIAQRKENEINETFLTDGENKNGQTDQKIDLSTLVTRPGFEPRQAEPESAVLPLYYRAMNGYKINKKAEVLPSALLPHLDSNQDKQYQKLSYYHYTIGQSANGLQK
jgi:hypothetical protein